MVRVRKVALVELTVYERFLPLVAGYLQAYASTDEEIRREVEFVKYTTPLTTELAAIVAHLVGLEAEVYGFSCYVWNMGLVRRVVAALRAARPDVHIILGGYQVSGGGQTYLSPSDERTVICDGEGERTFLGYLRALRACAGASNDVPDFSAVRGLTFYRAGELVTQPPEEKILDMSQIPSPFLGGMFDEGEYTYGVLETNRGCPYRCSFCAWGGPDSRVGKFAEDRIYKEIDWLTARNFFGIFIADANWGLLRRDLDFSRHIAKRRAETGFPWVVIANMAKNKADRLVEIAEILQGAGIATTQSIAVQSMNDTALQRVRRGNIKLAAYETALQQLGVKQLSSYVELIWPLPGETLQSFKDGIERLCRIGAQSFIPYPLMLLRGTPMYDERASLGFDVFEDTTGISEYEMVVATKEVSREEVREGLWFCFAVLSLYNTRALYCLLRWLHETGQATFSDVFTAFAAFARAQTSSVTANYARSLEDFSYAHAAHWGRLLHYVLHEHRREFRGLLHDFVRAQPWWSPTAEALFEIDTVNTYYPYRPTRIDPGLASFRHITVKPSGKTDLRVDVKEPHRALVEKFVEMRKGNAADGAYLVRYFRQQVPYMPAKGLDHNANYCHSVAENVRNHMPMWEAAALPATTAATP